VKSPNALASADYKRDADIGTYDLIIYDQCAPATPPRANTLFFGRLPPGPEWRGGADAAGDKKPANEKVDAEKQAAEDAKSMVVAPQVLDWDRSHPLLANVELDNVVVADSLALRPPAGGTVLIDSTKGVIGAIAPRDAYQDAVIGFEILGKGKDGSTTWNTTWTRRMSFPTFCLNTVEFLGGRTEDSQLKSTKPGRPVELRAAGNTPELTVVDPTGKQFAVRRNAGDVFQFQDTNQLGVYEVRRGDQVIERFAVNLFDRQESDVRVRKNQNVPGTTVQAADIRIGNTDVAATMEQTPSRVEAWKWVLACALFVLILEWYIYNRRVYL
jgi:hypothetical protein